MQHAYLELKLAWELFQKAPEGLSEPERQRLSTVADKQESIEQRILGTPEAARVVVPGATLDNRLAEIRQRYASDDEMQQDLERLGLQADTLAAAVERDLKVEAVLDKVAADVPAVSAIDAEIYYRLHPEAFDRPETRKLRHILITYANPREKQTATATLERLRSTWKTAQNRDLPALFAQAALRHSQCPTAMDGGLLGTVKRGQLYSELEPAAFALALGEVSAVLVSPVGLHLIYCEEIPPAGMLAFAEVREHIVERLGDKRRRDAQRSWIKQLFARSDTRQPA